MKHCQQRAKHDQAVTEHAYDKCRQPATQVWPASAAGQSGQMPNLAPDVQPWLVQRTRQASGAAVRHVVHSAVPNLLQVRSELPLTLHYLPCP